MNRSPATLACSASGKWQRQRKSVEMKPQKWNNKLIRKISTNLAFVRALVSVWLYVLSNSCKNRVNCVEVRAASLFWRWGSRLWVWDWRLRREPTRPALALSRKIWNWVLQIKTFLLIILLSRIKLHSSDNVMRSTPSHFWAPPNSQCAYLHNWKAWFIGRSSTSLASGF